jgi:hypothetical protein
MANQNITKILWIHVQISSVWILSLESSWFFAWHLHSIIYSPHPHITLLVLDTKQIVRFTMCLCWSPYPKTLTSRNNSLNGPARFSPTFKIDVHKRTKFISPIQKVFTSFNKHLLQAQRNHWISSGVQHLGRKMPSQTNFHKSPCDLHDL